MMCVVKHLVKASGLGSGLGLGLGLDLEGVCRKAPCVSACAVENMRALHVPCNLVSCQVGERGECMCTRSCTRVYFGRWAAMLTGVGADVGMRICVSECQNGQGSVSIAFDAIPEAVEETEARDGAFEDLTWGYSVSGFRVVGVNRKTSSPRWVSTLSSR